MARHVRTQQCVSTLRAGLDNQRSPHQRSFAIAEEMANYSDMLVESGLLHLKGGNYSVRSGENLIITPTKCFKKDIVPEKLLCTVNMIELSYSTTPGSF